VFTMLGFRRTMSKAICTRSVYIQVVSGSSLLIIDIKTTPATSIEDSLGYASLTPQKRGPQPASMRTRGQGTLSFEA
jgi:hypothetical protein